MLLLIVTSMKDMWEGSQGLGRKLFKGKNQKSHSGCHDIAEIQYQSVTQLVGWSVGWLVGQSKKILVNILPHIPKS